MNIRNKKILYLYNKKILYKLLNNNQSYYFNNKLEFWYLSSQNSDYNAYSTIELTNHLGNVLSIVSDRVLYKQGDDYDPYNKYNDSENQCSVLSGKISIYPDILDYNDYYPFGSTFEDASKTALANDYRYGFNGMESDDEVKGENNSLDFGARIYDPRLGRWLSLDPLASKFPYESPYVLVGNSPIIFVDPDGKEKIVVTGGEYDGDRYKYNFVDPAIKQLKAYKAKAETEQVTWAVMNIGYTEDQITSFKSTAEELGVNLVMMNSADELSVYLNKKTTKLTAGQRGTPVEPDELITTVSDSRSKDLVTDVSVFGHGFVGSMEFGYHQEGSEDFSFGTDDVENLNSDAFNNESCSIDIYTCNAATPTNGENSSTKRSDLYTSLAGQIAKQTKTKVTGYQGRTDYAKINEGEGIGDKINRKWNGYNTNGSQNLPKAGTQSGGKSSQRYSFDKQTKSK